MRGPPTPTKRTSGCWVLSACIRPEPRMSPEASPATSATNRGRDTSAGDATAGCLDRVSEQRHFGDHFGITSQFGKCLLDGKPLAVDDLVGVTQGGDGLGTETPTAHAFEIHAARRCRIAKHRNKGRYILADSGAHAGKAEGADMAVLVHQRIAGKDRPIADMHVTGKRRVVDQNAVVGNDAVMANMCIGHDQVVITDGGFSTVLHGAPVDGHPFPDHVVIADHQTRRLTLVFEIRRILTYRRKLVDAVVSTYTSRPLDDYVGCNHRTLADLDVRADDRPGSDLNVVGQPCGRIDDGARVYQAHIFCSAQMISAEHTGLPSTLARQSNFQMPRLALIKDASSTSWSPGTTGWRKRSLSEPTK